MLTPQYDNAGLLEALENRSRGPFRALLARVLGSAPSEEAIATLAEKHPDRYGQLLAIVARTAGYTEKLEVEGTFTQRIQDLSDAELLVEAARYRPSVPEPCNAPSEEVP